MTPLLLAACAPPLPVSREPAAPVAAWLDEAGRTVIHRGANVDNAAKSRAGGYHHGLTNSQLAELPAHGITLVRLLTFWEAIEPERGEYDDEQLARFRAEVQTLGSLGIDVIADLHQDVFGQGFGFTGFPEWACTGELYAAYEPPASWSTAYADPAVAACFDRFWGSPELQDAYARMAARLASELSDLPELVGLDVMNEPFWGTMQVRDFEREVLPAFYRRVLDAVRPVAPRLRLWLEPAVSADLAGSSDLDVSGLDDTFLGYAPHLYPPWTYLGQGYDGDLEAETEALDRMAGQAEAMGVPLLLGEYAVLGDEQGAADYARDVQRVVEARGGSTAWWSYDPGNMLDQDGRPREFMDAFATTRPYRIPGELLGVAGDGTTRLRLDGEGEMVWVMVQGEGRCEVVSGSGVVLGEPRWEPPLLSVQVRAGGEAELRCR